MNNLIFLGLAGAGKGTQAKMLSGFLNVPMISSGDLFRFHLGNKTELGIEANKFMSTGALVPDNITINMILKRIQEQDCKEGFILDGFPRTLDQAESLNKSIVGDINTVVYIEVEETELLRRLSDRVICEACNAILSKLNINGMDSNCPECDNPSLSQRQDDLPEVVQNRLKTQIPLINQLVNYYKQKEILISVNGQQNKDIVEFDIQTKLGLH
jgi:adenylate kinase